MANAISIFTSGSTRAELNKIQAGIVANLQKNSNVFRFKSNSANLSQKAGSYEFKRYTNSTSAAYGTARTANKGTQLKVPPVVVNVDTHREIVEEVSGFDADRFGLDASVLSMVNQRKANHEMTLAADTGRAFWAEAWVAAAAAGNIHVGPTSSDAFDEKLEDVILALETTENNYVRGVDRTLMGGVLAPKQYSRLKTAVNKMYNANFAVADEDLRGINGVALFSELFLPAGAGGIIMARESVAQPLTMEDYAGERIPLSNDYAIELYYDFGTKALAGDLIHGFIPGDGTHTKVSMVDSLPSSGQDAATFYVTKSASASYNPENAISGTNYPAGTVFTYASSAWSQVK